MNYESEFIQGGSEAGNRPKIRKMINLSSFIAFHARRTPDRPALKYRGEEISYAASTRVSGRWQAGSLRGASAPAMSWPC